MLHSHCYVAPAADDMLTLMLFALSPGLVFHLLVRAISTTEQLERQLSVILLQVLQLQLAPSSDGYLSTKHLARLMFDGEYRIQQPA